MHVSEQHDARPLPVVAQISRAIVGIHAERFGRGPTRAETVWTDEVVVGLLQDIFTTSEQVLVDAGRFEQGRANRQALEEAVESLLREAVEKATGSRVLAALNQVSPDRTGWGGFLLEGPGAAQPPGRWTPSIQRRPRTRPGRRRSNGRSPASSPASTSSPTASAPSTSASR